MKKIYSNQKHRGAKGAGISLFRGDGNEIARIRFKKPKSVLCHPVIAKAQKGDLMLFHHRLPTSTPNIRRCNHPICSEDRSIHLIHNGWVLSPDEHLDRLEKHGHRFETRLYWTGKKGVKYDFTDSEAIVHELEENLRFTENPEMQKFSDRVIIKAMEKTVGNLSGALTFAFMHTGSGSIFIHRGTPPCVVFRDKLGNIWFSSEFPNGNPMFRLVRSLREGEIVKISENGFRSLKRLRVRPSAWGAFSCGLFPRNAGTGLWGDLDWHYSPDAGDYSSIEIQKAVDSVWERIMDDHRWYLGFYVSLSEIIGMLKDELRKLHIFVPEKVVNRKASEIWESL